MMTDEQRFKKFTLELAKLSKKYGVAVRSVGGIWVGDIKNIEYSNDYSSGDLEPYIQWAENAKEM